MTTSHTGVAHVNNTELAYDVAGAGYLLTLEFLSGL